MRTIKYAVINTKENTKLFSSLNFKECEKFLATMKDNTNCHIGHKWFSI